MPNVENSEAFIASPQVPKNVKIKAGAKLKELIIEDNNKSYEDELFKYDDYEEEVTAALAL